VSHGAGVPAEVDVLVARAAGANMGHSRTIGERAQPLLREAIERLRAAQPRLSPYAARRAVVLHLRTRHPEYSLFALKPEPQLSPGPDAPACPRTDPRYRHFLQHPDDYWLDRAYEALLALPPEELPDGAMLALCVMTREGIQGLLRGDEPGEPVTTLIPRCGPRLYPAAVEYLSHPERYGWNAAVSTSATGSRWFPPSAGVLILRAAGDWPGAEAAPLFRLALEAGWNYAGEWLPDRDWARAMLQAFGDSPYGPPDRPSRRPPG
jgi:hypothetical protein